MISSLLNHPLLTKLVRKIFSTKYCIMFVYTGLEENVSCCGIAVIWGVRQIAHYCFFLWFFEPRCFRGRNNNFWTGLSIRDSIFIPFWRLSFRRCKVYPPNQKSNILYLPLSLPQFKANRIGRWGHWEILRLLLQYLILHVWDSAVCYSGPGCCHFRSHIKNLRSDLLYLSLSPLQLKANREGR